ncbi:MAG TPA: fluoride efflux transporter CrcB [Candidatus Limnocylindria bacterium]|nr:fluoride efflux transporter CrcB [Candidatus Limnocylindria bacterium]
MLILVMLGAAVGAPSRWLLDRAIQSGRAGVFPLGTLTINVLGSLLLGVVLGASEYGPGTAQLVALVGTGFCGGFTTYSSFGFETIRLAEEGSYAEAGLNIVVSLTAGLVAALAGWYLAEALWA